MVTPASPPSSPSLPLPAPCSEPPPPKTGSIAPIKMTADPINGHPVPVPSLKNGDVASQLPREAPQAWSKPVGNAKAYSPDHPGRFHVVFQESAQDGVEAYSSKLVADRVSAA